LPDSALDTLLPPPHLLCTASEEFIAKERGEFVPGTLLISGTIPMAEGIDQFADRWRVELADPTSGASIELAYDVVPLPAPIG
jgi:hypothetical protein